MIGAAVRRVLRPLDPRSRAQIESDIGEEFAFHLAMLERDVRQEGLTGEAARAECERRFGNVAALRRRCVREATWEKTMLQKLNLALLAVIAGVLAWSILQGRAAQQQQLAEMERLTAVVQASGTSPRTPIVPVHVAPLERYYIDGVKNPGQYAVPEGGVTLRQAIVTAGGVDGPAKRIAVVHDDGKGGREERFTLGQDEYRKAAGGDVALRAGDFVRVEGVDAAKEAREAGLTDSESGTVYVEGEVVHPGAYSTGKGVTLRRVLTAAGGPKGTFKRAVVVSGDGQGGHLISFTLTGEEYYGNPAGADVELRPNEIVRVE